MNVNANVCLFVYSTVCELGTTKTAVAVGTLDQFSQLVVINGFWMKFFLKIIINFEI